SFLVVGWAADLSSPAGNGVETVQVYEASADSAQPPVFLGQADDGATRSDLGAVYGAQFTQSGYVFRAAATLAPGAYRWMVFAHSTVSVLVASQAHQVFVAGGAEPATAGQPATSVMTRRREWGGATGH